LIAKQPFEIFIPFAKVLVPVLSTDNHGELPLTRFGLIEPLSVEVAFHGVEMAAKEVAGRRSSRMMRNLFILESKYIKIRGLR
jgi:hypothetical protein